MESRREERIEPWKEIHMHVFICREKRGEKRMKIYTHVGRLYIQPSKAGRYVFADLDTSRVPQVLLKG